MKLILIILDGVGDIGSKTPLSMAKKPNMELLAGKGRCGLLDIGYRNRVDSDFGYLNLLGCYSKEDYPGRGYLEALGIGLRPGPGDVCIRGNFATLDREGNIKDRRAGRDETGTEELAELLDGMEIDGVTFRVKKSVGHRVAIVMKGRNLSDNLNPNDPERTGVALPQVTANEKEAKFTASVLNKFLYRANRILSQEPVNRRRDLPANTILIRNLGRKKDVRSFKDRYGFRGCCIAGIAIAKGVSRFLGMDTIEVKGATGMPDTNLKGKREATIRALKTHDFVFLHINGTDILSHDAKPREKKRMIEKIDCEIGKIIKNSDFRETVFIITCDHRTASAPGYKKYRHLKDPVPVVISGDGIKPDGIMSFDEKSCARGFRLEKNGLMPFVLGQM